MWHGAPEGVTPSARLIPANAGGPLHLRIFGQADIAPSKSACRNGAQPNVHGETTSARGVGLMQSRCLLRSPPRLRPRHEGGQDRVLSPLFLDTVAQGDCVELMRQMPAASVDFILTDPPYLVAYRSRRWARDPE